jgi:hypothetical protein
MSEALRKCKSEWAVAKAGVLHKRSRMLIVVTGTSGTGGYAGVIATHHVPSCPMYEWI